NKLSRTMGVAALAYVLGAVAVLWVTTPLHLSGLNLDRALRIEPGSQLPTSSLDVGDRVVEVDERPVGTHRELSTVLASRRGQSAVVTIETEPGEASIVTEVSQLALDP